MIKKRPEKYYLNALLIFLFLGHGILYFLYPEAIFDRESPLKWIKYVLLFLFFIFNIKRVKSKNIGIFVLLFIGFFVLLAVSHQISIFTQESIFIAFHYLVPISIMFLIPVLDKIKFNKIIEYLIALSILATFLEYFVFKGIFTKYDHSNSAGYVRIVSIFVNPNNAAIIFSLFFIYINENIKTVNSKKYLKKIVLLVTICFAMYLTGSKTGMVLILLYVLMYSVLKLRTQGIFKRANLYHLFFLLLLAPLILMFTPWENFDLSTRDLTLETGSVRYTQMLEFFRNATNGSLLTPDFYNIGATYDLVFLQIWGDFSLIGLLFFIAFLIVIYVKKIRFYRSGAKISFLLLLISGFSVSFLTIWPVAYIFWYVLFSNRFMHKKMNSKTILYVE